MTSDVALTPPWEVPAPLLGMLAYHARQARPGTRIRLTLTDIETDGSRRQGRVEVDADQAKQWLAEQDVPAPPRAPLPRCCDQGRPPRTRHDTEEE